MFTDSLIVFALVYCVARYSLLFRLRINKMCIVHKSKNWYIIKRQERFFLTDFNFTSKASVLFAVLRDKKIPAVLAFFSFLCKSNLKNVDGDQLKRPFTFTDLKFPYKSNSSKILLISDGWKPNSQSTSGSTSPWVHAAWYSLYCRQFFSLFLRVIVEYYLLV